MCYDYIHLLFIKILDLLNECLCSNYQRNRGNIYPPQGDLKTNEEDHHKVIYFDVLLLFTQCEGTKMSGLLLLHLKQIFRSNYKVQVETLFLCVFGCVLTERDICSQLLDRFNKFLKLTMEFWKIYENYDS